RSRLRRLNRQSTPFRPGEPPENSRAPGGTAMRIIRFVETSEGGSRFEELDVPFSQPYLDEFGNTYHMTRAFSSSGVIVDLPEGLDQDWHVAPSRQIVIVLTGRLEVETTDGEVRRWGR